MQPLESCDVSPCPQLRKAKALQATQHSGLSVKPDVS